MCMCVCMCVCERKREGRRRRGGWARRLRGYRVRVREARQRAHDLGGSEHADVRVRLQEPARRHRHVGRAHPGRSAADADAGDAGRARGGGGGGGGCGTGRRSTRARYGGGGGGCGRRRGGGGGGCDRGLRVAAGPRGAGAGVRFRGHVARALRAIHCLVPRSRTFSGSPTGRGSASRALRRPASCRISYSQGEVCRSERTSVRGKVFTAITVALSFRYPYLLDCHIPTIQFPQLMLISCNVFDEKLHTVDSFTYSNNLHNLMKQSACSATDLITIFNAIQKLYRKIHFHEHFTIVFYQKNTDCSALSFFTYLHVFY